MSSGRGHTLDLEAVMHRHGPVMGRLVGLTRSSGAEEAIVRITAVPLTAEAFAPYGDVLAAPAVVVAPPLATPVTVDVAP